MSLFTTEAFSVWTAADGDPVDHVLTDPMPSATLFYVRVSLELNAITGTLSGDPETPGLHAQVYYQYSWDQITWATAVLTGPIVFPAGIAAALESGSFTDISGSALPWIRFGVRVYNDDAENEDWRNHAYATLRIESRSYDGT